MKKKIILEKIKRNELMSEKHIKGCRALNYSEHFLVFVSDVSSCVSISVFASLVGVPVGIASSEVGLKICAMTARIKKHKSIVKKKKKKHNKIVLLAKTKLNTIEVLISKSLLNSYINHNDFVSVNNVLREYNGMKEGIENPENAVEYTI